MFSYIAAAEPQRRCVAIIAGPTALLLTALPSEASLTRFMVLARTGEFDGVLDELRNQSDPDFEHFALLQADTQNKQVAVAVGGHASAEFDGSTAFLSPGQTATTEVHMGQIERIQLMIGPTPDTQTPALPISDGVVLVTSIVWKRDDAGIEPADLLPQEVAVTTGAPEPNVAAHKPAPAPAPEIARAHPLGTGKPSATNFFDQLFEQTRFHDVEVAAVRDTGAAAPEGQVMAEAEAAAGPPTLTLVLPNGAAEPLDQAILVGRKPTVPQDESLASFRLVTLGHRNSGLSRTHLRIEPHSDGVAVTDLDSTNGTVLLRASGESVALLPHTSLLAQAGDQVILGTTIVLSIAARPSLV